MILSETHIIKSNKKLDELTFKTKNLYNKANYMIRQEFITNGHYLSKFETYNIFKDIKEYKVINNTRIARCVLRTLDANWRSFFEANKKWKQHKEFFSGKPHLPNYLDKKGKFTAIFVLGSFRKDKENKIGLSQTDLRIKTKIQGKIIEIQLKPLKNNNEYKICIMYDFKEQEQKINNQRYCGIDLGINNLMTLTSNVSTVKPIIINGRPLKSINQYYNKKKAGYQSKLPDKDQYVSKKIINLTEKRNRKIDDYLHNASKKVIDFCKENNLNTIIIGYNDNWKKEVNMGKRTNQNFVNIPDFRLVWMIQYKARKDGFLVIKREESYTSKCSALDLEEVRKHDVYLGKRIKRGLFKTSTGKLVNADVNGSLNIIRKAVSNVFLNTNEIEDCAVNPVRINFPHKLKKSA